MGRTEPQGLTAEHRRAIGVTLLATLLVVAGSLPWGTVQITADPIGGLLEPLGVQGVRMTFAPTLTFTAWDSTVSPLGLELPNTLPILAGAAVAVLCWLGCLGIWKAPRAVPVLLCAYGLIQTLWFLVTVSVNARASLGIGSVLALAAWVAIGAVLVRARDRAQPARRSAEARTAGAPRRR